MAIVRIIDPLSIPHPDFALGQVIEPEEFDANNSAIQGKVNEVIGQINENSGTIESIDVKVNEANTKADGAIVTANTANTTASTANANSTTAVTSATNAVNTANNASNVATNAFNKATQVEADFNAIEPILEQAVIDANQAVASVAGKADVSYVDTVASNFVLGVVANDSIVEAKLHPDVREKLNEVFDPTAIENEIATLGTEVDTVKYQTPIITGVDITINSVAGFPAKFKLDTPLTGAITVNTLPLRNPDGTDVTELEVGLYEVLADATFFTLRNSGGGLNEAIYGKVTAMPELIDRTTPVQVINQAYDTSGNGGRKLVRLDNGWLVAVERTTPSDRVEFQVDKQDGNGFVPFKYLVLSGSGNATANIALASYANMVYLLVTNGASQVSFRGFNATSVSVYDNTFLITSVIDASQTAVSGGSIAIDSSGHLHATWSSKNSTYPNSFNIRYSKSIDGGATWASPTQITTNNASGTDWTTPSIILNALGQPCVFCVINLAGNYTVRNIYHNGTSWVERNIYNAPSHLQINPSATVDSNGVIYVVWEGRDVTTPSHTNIKCKKSLDSGVTWIDSGITNEKITNIAYNQGTPSISVNTNNEIFIMFTGTDATYPSFRNLKLASYINSFWVIEYITLQNSIIQQNPSSVDNFKSFEKPLTIWNNANTDIKFYGKWTDQVKTFPFNLVDAKGNPVKVKQNEYVYVNEDTQLVLDNPTIESFDRTTPTQVVNVAYDTSGNGGRKLVRLDNGTLVSVVKNGTTDLRLYKSTDNGATFSLMKTESGNFSYFSICTDGANIYLIYTDGFGNVIFKKFSNDGTQLLAKVVDASQTGAWSGISLTIDSNGHLHATWASKNATYPNSFNIRYSKSTDGGVTWASPTQVTTINLTVIQYINPCIVALADGHPMIFFEDVQASFYAIAGIRFNGTTWQFMGTNNGSGHRIYFGGSYTQSNPSATVDSNGVIHVVWHGRDATDSNTDNIRYSKSTDKGATWSAMQKLTSGNSYDQKFASITTDKLNNVYILFSDRVYDTTSYELAQLKFTSSWVKTMITTTHTTLNPTYPSVCDNYKDFENPLVIFSRDLIDVKFYGKWTESNSPQIIPSLATATSESKLQAIGEGTLKSFGSTDKFYVGYHSKTSNGFTPL